MQSWQKVGKHKYCILSTIFPIVHQSLPLANLSSLYVLPVVFSLPLSVCMHVVCVCAYICAASFAVPVVGSLWVQLQQAGTVGIGSMHW